MNRPLRTTFTLAATAAFAVLVTHADAAPGKKAAAPPPHIASAHCDAPPKTDAKALEKALSHASGLVRCFEKRIEANPKVTAGVVTLKAAYQGGPPASQTVSYTETPAATPAIGCFEHALIVVQVQPSWKVTDGSLTCSVKLAR